MIMDSITNYTISNVIHSFTIVSINTSIRAPINIYNLICKIERFLLCNYSEQNNHFPVNWNGVISALHS